MFSELPIYLTLEYDVVHFNFLASFFEIKHILSTFARTEPKNSAIIPDMHHPGGRWYISTTETTFVGNYHLNLPISI